MQFKCPLPGWETANGAAGCVRSPERQERLDADLNGRWRRIAEAAIATAGLIALAPVLLVAALAIALDSDGPIFLWQERVGKGGCRFQMLKLRTMVTDAEPDGRAVWAQPGDPRATRVGTVLRRSHLDELPQLWNVLRGEMSLIGPRPERPELVELLLEQIPRYHARHTVLPGITGWAQVHVQYASSVEDAVRKLEFDLYYVEHRSFGLDARILLRTLTIALGFVRL